MKLTCDSSVGLVGLQFNVDYKLDRDPSGHFSIQSGGEFPPTTLLHATPPFGNC